MKRVLLLIALGALFPATANAVTISPEKQAVMNARDWTAQDSLTVEPLATESSSGRCNRTAKRAKSRVAIRDAAQSPMVQVWTSIGACLTDAGNLHILGVGYGQGSSGRGWVRKSPFREPFLSFWWPDKPRQFASRARAIYEYGKCDACWWTLTAYAQATRVNGTIRFKRVTSIR